MKRHVYIAVLSVWFGAFTIMSQPAFAATTAIEQTNYDKIYFGLMVFFIILALFTFRMKPSNKK
ncbi:hypothetical protein [Kurthia massiliensis]|uniref:hypothetical protein n=1 Tax=Kurthia massiliensis TaxID=1033739 RepID=UPI000289FAE0|nr:hypothetical protein [Kurthia massiliensis]